MDHVPVRGKEGLWVGGISFYISKHGAGFLVLLCLYGLLRDFTLVGTQPLVWDNEPRQRTWEGRLQLPSYLAGLILVDRTGLNIEHGARGKRNTTLILSRYFSMLTACRERNRWLKRTNAA